MSLPPEDIIMKYEQRLRLSKSKYIAVLDGALVIVTTNRKGEPIRYAIFEKKEQKRRFEG